MKKDGRLAKIGVGIWPFAVYLVIYEAAALVCAAGVQQILQASNAELKSGILEHTGDVTALTTAVAMTAGFLPVSKMAGREVTMRLALCCRRLDLALMSAGAVFLSLSLNILLSLSGLTQSSGAGTLSLTVSPILGILVYGILSPMIEETVFRGLVYGRLKDGAAEGHIGAVMVSSFLFGLYHGNPAQGIYAFCMGVVLCFFMEETGSLPAAALLHGVINVLVLFLSESGLYEDICSTSWMICLLGAAACCGIALWFLKQRQ